MKYFASEDSSQIQDLIGEKVEQYRQFLRNTGRLNKLRKAQATFAPRSVSIEDVGSYGEFASVTANEYSNLVRHIKSMVQSQKPAWDAKASNSDSKSIASAQLANSILDYVMTDKRAEHHLLKALDFGLRLAEGWVSVEWNAKVGSDVAVDETGFPVKTGDVELQVHHMLEVSRDFAETSLGQCKWFIISKRMNRYELIARYPAFQQQIENAESPKSLIEYSLTSNDDIYRTRINDMVEVHTLYHDRSQVLPEGRMTVVAGDAVLFDGELPYQRLPLVCFRPEDETDAPFGHTQFFDLLPLQETADLLMSILCSNNRAFGTQSILSPKGSGVEITELSEGLNLVEYAGNQPPQPLQLTASAPETYRLLDQTVQTMERLSGVSQIARGSVQVAQLSGSAMALLQSNAIQFASSINQAYTALLEDVGTLVVQHYQSFAVAPRVVQLAGKAQGRTLTKEFSSQDLNGIHRVTVTSGNALSKTLAGRMEVAKDLMANGLVSTPEQYLEVLQSGQLTPLIESEMSQLHLVRSENEKLAEGEMVQVLVSDRHDLHMKEHLSILSSPEIRQDPVITQAVLAHVMEHMNQWKTADPAILALTGTPPAPVQPMAPPPPMDGQADAAPVMDPTPPPVQQAQEINQPNMPINPLTKERFDPNIG